MLAQDDNPVALLRDKTFEALRTQFRDGADAPTPQDMFAMLAEEDGETLGHLVSLLEFLYEDDDPDEVWEALGLGVRNRVAWFSLGETRVVKRMSPEGGYVYIISGVLAVNLDHPEIKYSVGGQVVSTTMPPLQNVEEDQITEQP